MSDIADVGDGSFTSPILRSGMLWQTKVHSAGGLHEHDGVTAVIVRE
jgi:hypothetical protein